MNWPEEPRWPGLLACQVSAEYSKGLKSCLGHRNWEKEVGKKEKKWFNKLGFFPAASPSDILSAGIVLNS